MIKILIDRIKNIRYLHYLMKQQAKKQKKLDHKFNMSLERKRYHDL